MKEIIGRWGLYPWWPENDIELVHPEDADEMRQLFAYGKVFECVGNEEGYLKIRYGSQCFRVKSSLFQAVPHPGKGFGETVRFQKGGEILTGTVLEIQWHYNKEQPFFFVTVDGKRLKKRYWLIDFMEDDSTE